MDRLDRAILHALQANGRERVTEIADRIGLSPTPCARRIAVLENEGVIEGYAAIVNQAKLGLPISAFVSVELKEQSAELIDRFEKAVASFEEVMDCWLMTGSQDYLLRVVSADLQSYERFLQEKLTHLDGISSLRTRFALRKAIGRTALPLDL